MTGPNESQGPLFPGWSRVAPVSAPDPELLDIRALARRWSTSVRTIRRLMAGGAAPRPVRISARVIRWRLSEVRRWEAALERSDAGRRGRAEH